MSTRIFTAGPWSAHKPFGKTWDDHGYRRICEVSRKGEILVVSALASNMVEPERGCVWGPDDAHLIAAAPELLNALQLILPLAKGYAPSGQTKTARATCDSWIAAAEAAIAKAEGKS